MLTISNLGKRFGISRTTILYYEREGLLQPASRAANGYRWYGEQEISRLERIKEYRSFGVAVRDIRTLLDEESELAHESLLKKRFSELEIEIQRLRSQQESLLTLLRQSKVVPDGIMTRERWSEIMRGAGMTEMDMRNWHREFESREPLAHQEFLESLNIDQAEIRRIRKWSRQRGP